MTLGESTMDILPFWPEFDDSVVVNEWLSVVMLIWPSRNDCRIQIRP